MSLARFNHLYFGNLSPQYGLGSRQITKQFITRCLTDLDYLMERLSWVAAMESLRSMGYVGEGSFCSAYNEGWSRVPDLRDYILNNLVYTAEDTPLEDYL